MKSELVLVMASALLLGAAAPMPAQVAGPVCDPNSSSYDPVACAVLRNASGRSQQRLLAMTENSRRFWAEIDAKNPPVVVDSRPGSRVAPKRRAKEAPPGSDPKALEVRAEALLSEFENGARAQPQALLGFAPNHLATACMLFAVRNYMILRGLDTVSPQLAREAYWLFRGTNRSPEAAVTLKDPVAAQNIYETLLIASMSLDADWRAARAGSSFGAIETLQRQARQNLEDFLRQNAAENLKQWDALEEWDRRMRAGGPDYWGPRITLRFPEAR